MLRSSLTRLPPAHLFVAEKGSRTIEVTLKRRLSGWVREARLEKTDLEPHGLRRTYGDWHLRESPRPTDRAG